LQIKTKIVSCHTAHSKPVKQEVNGTVILPPLVFPVSLVSMIAGESHEDLSEKNRLPLQALLRSLRRLPKPARTLRLGSSVGKLERFLSLKVWFGLNETHY